MNVVVVIIDTLRRGIVHLAPTHRAPTHRAAQGRRAPERAACAMHDREACNAEGAALRQPSGAAVLLCTAYPASARLSLALHP